MPTATTTLVQQKQETSTTVQLTIKSDLKLPALSSSLWAPDPSSLPQTSTSATLRSLYTRAARAFVLRDLETTQSLLQSAFSILKPPKNELDVLSDDRRRWDILRITFESTTYSSSSNSLPESLRYILSEAPQALISSMYSRSLSLFTPSNATQKTPFNAASLPTQVLVTLICASLKLSAPDIGRMIIENWLARRESYETSNGSAATDGDGYEKILELYCLCVLPKLDQWDYAKEFLEYESELPPQRREHLKTSLQNLHSQALVPRRTSRPLSFPIPLSYDSRPPSRSHSPAPSASSSSSVSTTSTHTVVPATPRGRSPTGLSSLSSRLSPPSRADSPTSDETDETTTPQASSSLPNGNHPPFRNRQLSIRTKSTRSRSKSRTHSSTSSGYSNFPTRSRVAHLSSSQSTLSLIKTSLSPYITNPRLITFLFLFIFIPLISFIVRLRQRRRWRLAGLGPLATGLGPVVIGGAAGSAAAVSNAELVRRRLHVSGDENGLLRKVWNDMVRAVGDAVKMAGSGLI